jgi:hypothetical protein
MRPLTYCEELMSELADTRILAVERDSGEEEETTDKKYMIHDSVG